MSGSWVGLMEMVIVFGALLGIGVIELVGLRLDRRKKEAQAREAAGKPED